MKDTYTSVRLAQKPQNSFSCYRCGRVILIADYLEGRNIQVNCNRCGFKKRVNSIKIEKTNNKPITSPTLDEIPKDKINEIFNT